MKAKIGQRWQFNSADGYSFQAPRSFVCEVINAQPIVYRVIQLVNEHSYKLGDVVAYGMAYFDLERFTYLEGQDAPQ